jgi:glycosyltransferase involved in cell wall biosynthesis
MQNELVSIIVPTYNTATHLYDLLNDLVAQTYTNIEIIVVDDGSTDNTRDIVAKYLSTDSRCKYFYQNNAGPSAARNSGIHRANGAYFLFVDSDDRVDSTLVETLYRLLQSYPADIAACRVQDIYKDEGWSFSQDVKVEIEFYDCKQATEETLRGRKVSAFVTSKLYSRYLFDHIEFPEHIRMIEDAYISLELVLSSKGLVQTNLPLYKYIHREGSLMHQTFEREKEDCVVLTHQRNLKLVEEQFPELSFVAHQRLVWAYLHLYDRLITSDYKDPLYEKELRQRILSSRKYVYQGDYFNKSRKIAIALLNISPNLYKKLVKYRKRNYQPR